MYRLPKGCRKSISNNLLRKQDLELAFFLVASGPNSTSLAAAMSLVVRRNIKHHLFLDNGILMRTENVGPDALIM